MNKSFVIVVLMLSLAGLAVAQVAYTENFETPPYYWVLGGQAVIDSTTVPLPSNSPPHSVYMGDTNAATLISRTAGFYLPSTISFQQRKANNGSGYVYFDYSTSPSGPWTRCGQLHNTSNDNLWHPYTSDLTQATGDPAGYYYLRITTDANQNGTKNQCWLDDIGFSTRIVYTLNIYATGLDGLVTPIYKNTIDTGFDTSKTISTPDLAILTANYSPGTPPTGYHWVATTIPVVDGDFTAGNNYTYSITFTLEEDPLPVELSSFTVVTSVTNQAMLTWVTQSETGVAGFNIYRGSTDVLADAEMLNTFIEATNTSQQQSYIYVDEELWQSGTYYYWLESRDLDGADSFYGPVTFNLHPNDQQTPPVDLVTGIDGVYPNPFNPSATVSYTVSEAADVRIQIFNTKGQLVRDLLHQTRQPGTYRALWDGRDNNGRSCTSGLYNVVLRAGKDSFNRKAVLLK